MRRPALLFVAVLSVALPALAGTARADGPVSDLDVSNAYQEARARVDEAARALDRAQRAIPTDGKLWEQARAEVVKARQEIVKARRLFDQGKRQGSVGGTMGPSILHALASDMRRLAEIQRAAPPAPVPTPVDSTPEMQEAAVAVLTDAAKGLDAELAKFRTGFGGLPEGAMDAAADAARQIRELLANASRDPKAREALPAAMEKVLAFHSLHRTEWLALLATLEEIQHLRIELREASKPVRGGGLAGNVQGRVADPIAAASLQSRISELEGVARPIATTPLSLR